LNENFLFPFILAPRCPAVEDALFATSIITTHSPSVVALASVLLGDQELIVTVSFDLPGQIGA